VKTLEVASPCVQVCKLDAARDICTGCGRALAEIAEWSTASAERKQQICDLAAQRRMQMETHGKHPDR
jgi:predicted Fe-S protein YdhL (DUF1289 family)